MISGQPRKSLLLLERVHHFYENLQINTNNLAIVLGNLALRQALVGEFDAAESNLRQSIEICREFKMLMEFNEAVGHAELGQLLTDMGKFKESENELIFAIDIFTKLNEVQYSGVVWAYRSRRALLMSIAEEALEHAKKAHELADYAKNERDIVRAEYLLGTAHLMKENLSEAEKHLNEALIKDRKINLVDLEPDILLELGKLMFKQNRKPEALKFAHEALQIADRCEYRLKQADIHNFLSEFYLDASNIVKAREHGESAKERAGCGYVPAMEKAEKLLKDINLRQR